MTETTDGGGTVRDVLEGMAISTKNPNPGLTIFEGDKERQRVVYLQPPDVDMGEAQTMGGMLYAIFLELSKHRGRSEGVVPISWHDLLAYLQVNRLELDPIEVDVVMHLDDVFVQEVSASLNYRMEKARAAT